MTNAHASRDLNATATNPSFFRPHAGSNNIVQADLLYQRALSHDPAHTTALQNRQRTAPQVATHDRNMFAEIDARKRKLYQHSPHAPLMRKFMKELYYHNIYHSGAIEGNTLTLDQVRLVVDHKVAVAGKSIVEHNEVLGLSEALQFMNNTLLANFGDVTVENVKLLHKHVMGFAFPFIAGEFRSSQVLYLAFIYVSKS